MELRHLRYFVAVAEEGSVTLAAERRLHTAQPSLSRQIRDLEMEVGAQLLVRSVRGIEVTLVSQTSPELASALLQSKVDVAFLRPEPEMPDLVFKHLTSEPLLAILPSDHRLAALDVISPQDIVGETFVNVS